MISEKPLFSVPTTWMYVIAAAVSIANMVMGWQLDTMAVTEAVMNLVVVISSGIGIQQNATRFSYLKAPKWLGGAFQRDPDA